VLTLAGAEAEPHTVCVGRLPLVHSIFWPGVMAPLHLPQVPGYFAEIVIFVSFLLGYVRASVHLRNSIILHFWFVNKYFIEDFSWYPLLVDLAALVSSFATGSYLVTRRQSAGFGRGGVANPTSDSTIQVLASVQPASGRDLLRLPELRRTVETRVVYTITQLQVGDQQAGVEADLIAIDGQPWEVQRVETWQQPPYQGTAYRCIAQRAYPGAGP
jgi:hypothetical protein